MEKLTQQIAGAYTGAQVEITKYSEDIIVGAIKNVSNDRIWITHKPKQGYPHLTHDWAPYDQCRLILTPLSAISDEDAVEVARISNVCNPKIERNEQCIILTGDNGKTGDKKIVRSIRVYFHWSNTRCYHGNYEVIEYCLPIADYLRSRNYDLGYMGIRSLIDAGIAISSLDKTDSNVQP